MDEVVRNYVPPASMLPSPRRGNPVEQPVNSSQSRSEITAETWRSAARAVDKHRRLLEATQRGPVSTFSAQPLMDLEEQFLRWAADQERKSKRGR